MPVTCSDFISEAASYISCDEPSEIACRNSMSRAYYGLYHAALAYADSVAVPSVSDMSGPTHEKLRVFYSNNLHSDMAARLLHRRVGYILKQVHDNRVLADYKVRLEINLVSASSQLERCSECSGFVAQLESSKVA